MPIPVHPRPWRRLNWSIDMGKYLLAWLFGVPAFVLVLIYIFVH